MLFACIGVPPPGGGYLGRKLFVMCSLHGMISCKVAITKGLRLKSSFDWGCWQSKSLRRLPRDFLFPLIAYHIQAPICATLGDFIFDWCPGWECGVTRVLPGRLGGGLASGPGSIPLVFWRDTSSERKRLRNRLPEPLYDADGLVGGGTGGIGLTFLIRNQYNLSDQFAERSSLGRTANRRVARPARTVAAGRQHESTARPIHEGSLRSSTNSGGGQSLEAK
jgi:hypothetical protein